MDNLPAVRKLTEEQREQSVRRFPIGHGQRGQECPRHTFPEWEKGVALCCAGVLLIGLRRVREMKKE